MSNTITRELMLIEQQNICAWFAKEKDGNLTDLPIKAQWNLLSAVKQMQVKVQEFDEFRNKLIEDLRLKYFDSDEYSEEAEIPKYDENGEAILDENGNPIVEPGKRVKEEYMDQYRNDINKLNVEINNLLIEKTEYKFKGLNLEEIIDKLPDDTMMSIDDINMISFLDTEGE